MVISSYATVVDKFRGDDSRNVMGDEKDFLISRKRVEENYPETLHKQRHGRFREELPTNKRWHHVEKPTLIRDEEVLEGEEYTIFSSKNLGKKMSSTKDHDIMGEVGLKKHRENMRVEVNEELMRKLVEDFKEFGVNYWKATEDVREDVLLALRDAYMNTAAKLILNFGKVVTPVGEKWADIMQYVQVNPDCNQKCAMLCMDIRKRDSMFFD